jgi:hypothetical protein
MSHKRQTVCALSAIPVARFKTLARRHQLPKLVDAEYDDEGDDEGSYSDLDVLAIAVAERLMCQLGYSDGLPPGAAQQIVSNSLGLLEHPFTAGRADHWIGYVGQTSGGYNVSGTLAQILAEVRSASEECGPAARIFIVNVSDVLRDVKARAERLELPFPTAR